MVDLVVSGSPRTVFERLLRIKSVITFRKNNGWPLFQPDEEWRYQSEDDDRVCFPAGTRITTQRGNLPIEEVQPSDQVLTRNGFKKVLATMSKLYDGKMIIIEHEKGTLTSTFNHPIWKVGQGWIVAFQIQVGDFLETTKNERSRVLGVTQISLVDSDYSPTPTREKPIFSIIPLGVSMPINPINLKGNPQSWDQEIYTISSHRCLLDILNFERIKNFTSGLFQQGFSLILAIARKATELSINIFRLYSKLFSTVLAVNMFWGSATGFTTVMPIQMFLTSKHASTTFTDDIFGISSSTLPTTDGVSLFNRATDLEGFTALWTNLLNFFRFAITCSRTKLLSPFDATRNQIEGLITLRTDEPRSSPLSLGCLDLHQLTVGGHITQRLLSNNLRVYNLEVKDEEEYFANGILVHNCPICTGFDIDMFFRGDEIPERFPTFERKLNEGTATLHPQVHQNPEFAWLKGDCRCRMFMRNIEWTLEQRLHADKLQVI